MSCTAFHTLRAGGRHLLRAYSGLVLMGSLSQTTLSSHLDNPRPSPPWSSGHLLARLLLSPASLPGRLRQAKGISGRVCARPCDPRCLSCPPRPPMCYVKDRACLPGAFQGWREVSTWSRMDDSGCKTTGLSPEAAQDDHGSGEGDEGCAVADCVEGLHRQVVIILEQGTGHTGLHLGPATAPLGPTPSIPDQGLPIYRPNTSPFSVITPRLPDACSSRQRVSTLNIFRMY